MVSVGVLGCGGCIGLSGGGGGSAGGGSDSRRGGVLL